MRRGVKLLVRFALVLVAATGVALAFAAVVMGAPQRDVAELAVILAASGAHARRR